MNAAVGLMDGLGLDGDRCIRVIPRQLYESLFKISLTIFSGIPEIKISAMIGALEVVAEAKVVILVIVPYIFVGFLNCQLLFAMSSNSRSLTKFPIHHTVNLLPEDFIYHLDISYCFPLKYI